MKTLNRILLILALFVLPCQAYPPPFTTVLYSNVLTGLFINSGDQVQFTFAGTNYFTNGPTTLYINSDEDSTNLATVLSGPNMQWSITGSLILVGTNLQVSIQYSDDTNSQVSSFVMTNFNSFTNTLWFSCSAFDSLPEITLTETNMTGPNILEWYPFGLGVSLSNSLAQLAASTITNGALMDFDGGLITSDGSGNITAASYFGSLKDSGYATGLATYVATANGDGTWTWSPASGGAGGPMNFDGGLITSDGSGNISANSIGNTNGPIGINNFGDTGGETDPSQILMGQFSGGSPCWIVMQGQGKMSFYSGSGSFIHENYGIHLVCALGQEDTHPNWSDGPMVIGVDYSSSLPGTSFPDNSLSVEGYIGAGTYSPAYPVDVNGDINFTGNLRFNGSAVIQADSGGNGGTTLMLNASDTGTPMYLHVTSLGVATWTSSP